MSYRACFVWTLLLLLTAIHPAESAARASAEEPAAPWSEEKAWQWYNARPWLCGFNYLPSYAGNTTEFWQAETFDEELIDRELALAEGLGFNTIRVLVQYLVWEHDPEAFKRRFDRFLAIAGKHGLSVMPQFFDDCAFGVHGDDRDQNPYLGKQMDPVPGVFFPAWTPSPGHRRVVDRAAWPRLRQYVQDVIGRFAGDQRVVAWDLYNEPGNGGMGDKSMPLLEAVFGWARQARPTQPITSGVWGRAGTAANLMLANSDVVTFHMYSDAKRTRERIHQLKQHGRPVICTEWMIRIRRDTVYEDVFETHLPVFRQEEVGCYSWGLVNGRNQAQFQWGSKEGTPEPEIWFTDLFRDPDGTPYDRKETEFIRKFLSGQ